MDDEFLEDLVSFGEVLVVDVCGVLIDDTLEEGRFFVVESFEVVVIFTSLLDKDFGVTLGFNFVVVVVVTDFLIGGVDDKESLEDDFV